MKRLFQLALVLLLAGPFTLNAAHAQNKNYSSVSKSSKDKISHRYENNGVSREIEVKGDVVFNDDETDVVSISPRGYLHFKERDRRESHELRIESSRRGELEFFYKRDGRKVDFDQIDRDWYEYALLMLIRTTGVNAAERVARIVKSAGPDGVLDEVKEIPSSSIKTRYLILLFEATDLNNTELARALKMSKDIPSSGDLSRFLKASAPQFLAESSLSEGYFDVVKSVSSSGDKTRVLTHLVKEQLLNKPADYQNALGAAKHIPSSGDRSRFLTAAAKVYVPQSLDAYLDAVKGISSSGDKTRVLISLLREDVVHEAKALDQVVETGKAIPSSGDKARFLMAAATAYPNSPGQVVFEVTSTLSSSGDHARVLTSIAREKTLDDQAIEHYLKSARHISSSGDKSRTLTSIADAVAGNDDLVDVYIKVAESISSSSDYRRAMSALLN